MKFSQIPYTRPDLDAAAGAYEDMAAAIREAGSADAVLDQFRRAEALDAQLDTAYTVAYIRNTVDTRDAFYAAEQQFFDERLPALADKQLDVYRAVLASPFQGELAGRLGALALEKMAVAVKGQSPAVLDLMARENALTTEYQKLYASAQIPFDGRTLTVAQLAPYKEDPRRDVRKGALEAEGSWFDAHRREFDELYDELVQNRTQQARRMGYEDFRPLGAIRMGRVGYTLEDMAAYRAQVKRDVVPVAAGLKALQHRRTGIADPKFYDEAFAFPDGNARPTGTPEQILAAGKEMYHGLSPETAAFIDGMFENELFDVLAKPGKAPGGYCTSLKTYKMPFIFSNFNGTAGDVDVLTHEAGHAFADYVAARLDVPDILRSPGMESCEIHSMSMEFLTSDYHRLFFGPATAKYQLAHAEDALFFLPYGAMVDEFQHEVYKRPAMTADERNALWAGLEKQFRPWIDFDGLPFYGRGAGWQRQLHIYQTAFYYIDYCLAQTVALQFFTAWLADKGDAWRRYLALVNAAGTKTYPGLVAAAGFASPFAPGTLKDVAGRVGAWCEAAAEALPAARP